MAEPLIRMHTYEPAVLTIDEFEALHREVMAHELANDLTVADRICVRLLVEHASRYYECCQIAGRTPRVKV